MVAIYPSQERENRRCRRPARPFLLESRAAMPINAEAQGKEWPPVEYEAGREKIREFSNAVLPLISSGRIRPVVDSTFPFDAVRAAHERMEENASFGKIVLTW